MVCTRSSWPDPVGQSSSVVSSPRKAARHKEEAADGGQRPTLARAQAAAPKLLLAAAVVLVVAAAYAYLWAPRRALLLTPPSLAPECTCPSGLPSTGAALRQLPQQEQAEQACKARERAAQQRCLQYYHDSTLLLRSQLESCQQQLLQQALAAGEPGQAGSGVEQPGKEAAAAADQQGTSAPVLEESGKPSVSPNALQTSSSQGGRETAQETQGQPAEDTARRHFGDLEGHVLNATTPVSQLALVGLSSTGSLCGWALASTALCIVLAWRLRQRQLHAAPPAAPVQTAAAVKQLPALTAARPRMSSSKASAREGAGSIPALFEAGQEGQQNYQPEELHDSWSIQSSYGMKVEAVNSVGAMPAAVAEDDTAGRAACEGSVPALEGLFGAAAASACKHSPQHWRCNSMFVAARSHRPAADGRFQRIALTGALLEACPLFEGDDGSPSAAASLSSASEDNSPSSATTGSQPPSVPASSQLSPGVSVPLEDTSAESPWEVQEQSSVWLPEQSSVLDNPLYQPAGGEGGNPGAGPASFPCTARKLGTGGQLQMLAEEQPWLGEEGKAAPLAAAAAGQGESGQQARLPGSLATVRQCVSLVDEGLAEGLRQLAEVDEALMFNFTAGQKQ